MATGNALTLLWSDTGDLNIEGGLVCDAWLQYLFLLTGHDENLWQNVREKGGPLRINDGNDDVFM